jgi:hypothetical protein
MEFNVAYKGLKGIDVGDYGRQDFVAGGRLRPFNFVTAYGPKEGRRAPVVWEVFLGG